MAWIYTIGPWVVSANASVPFRKLDCRKDEGRSDSMECRTSFYELARELNVFYLPMLHVQPGPEILRLPAKGGIIYPSQRQDALTNP
jgi:hypothetical protein